MCDSSEVLVVGGIGIDTNVYPWEDPVDWSREGHFSRNLDCVGQTAGYSARGFAALEARVALFAAVGMDFGGAWIRQVVAEEGIEARFMIDPQGTKRSINLMLPDGRRRNFYDGKGSMEQVVDHAAFLELLERTTLVHFSIVNWARELLPAAVERGKLLSCDLQDLPDLDDPYRQDFIRACYILFFSGVNLPDPEAVVARALALGRRRGGRPSTVVCGLGSGGCLAGDESGIRRFPAIAEGPPIVDTNGAGDSLAVGFLWARVLKQHSLEQAVHAGQLCARHCCTLRGTSVGLLGLAELEARLGVG